jgi:glucosamine--fructose-6-phosphate aminotransferase (isomerizing)
MPTWSFSHRICNSRQFTPKEKSLNSLMLDEARSAPECVAIQMKSDADLYAEASAYLRAADPASVVTVARGSSDHAASFFAYLSALRGGRLVSSLPMSLLTLHHAPLRFNAACAVAISQSGRSPDLCTVMSQFHAGGAATLALINDVSSPLTQSVHHALPLNAGAERSVAATKSFICSVVGGARLLGEWFHDADLLRALHELPQSLHSACLKDWSAAIDVLKDADRVMIIGRGTGLAIAQEAALKLKETCAIQAEAFSSAEVRHGPMALVEPGYPMLVFAPRGPAQPDLLNLARDMRSRGASVLLAASADVGDRQLTLAPTLLSELDPIAAIQSFYPMVEALARARGTDPDRPRHLSKVTSTL